MSRIKFSGQHVMNFAMAAISAYVLLTALKWPFKTAFFPFVIGASVFLMSFAELLIAIYEEAGGPKKKKKKEAMDFSLSEDIDPAVAKRRTFSAFGWVIGFFVLLFLFSFNVGIPLFVFLYTKFQGKEKLWVSIAMTVGCWFFFWGLFVWLLDTPLTEGLFFHALRAIGIG